MVRATYLGRAWARLPGRPQYSPPMPKKLRLVTAREETGMGKHEGHKDWHRYTDSDTHFKAVPAYTTCQGCSCQMMCVCVCVCVCVCDAPHCIPLVCRANTCVGADNKARLQRGERPGCNVSSHQTHTRSVNNQTFPSCTVVSLSLSLRAVNLFIKEGGRIFFFFFFFFLSPWWE